MGGVGGSLHVILWYIVVQGELPANTGLEGAQEGFLLKAAARRQAHAV